MNDKDARTYIRVHDGIIDHPKVEPLTDRAFRLLLESWCYCSRHLTDGRIPLTVWRKRGTAKARRELVEAGLVEQHDGYVTMHDYLEHQRSADEVEEKREARRRAGALGNHNRWHAPRGIYDPECPICVANGQQDGSHEGSQGPSHDPSPSDRKTDRKCDRKTSPETETESESETQFSSGHLGEGESPTGRASDPPAPKSNPEGPRPADRCARHRDHDDPPPCGQCADARRAAEQWDAQHEAARQRIADEISQARNDPRMRCKHGADGGLYIRPDTGQSATCAQCRRTERQAS